MMTIKTVAYQNGRFHNNIFILTISAVQKFMLWIYGSEDITRDGITLGRILFQIGLGLMIIFIVNFVVAGKKNRKDQCHHCQFSLWPNIWGKRCSSTRKVRNTNTMLTNPELCWSKWSRSGDPLNWLCWMHLLGLFWFRHVLLGWDLVQFLRVVSGSSQRNLLLEL